MPRKKNILQEAENLGAFRAEVEPTKPPTTETKMTDQNDSFSDDSFTFQPDYSETYEEKALPAGTEAQFEIRSASVGTSQKTGGKYIMLGMTLPDEPEAKDFNEFLMLPSPSDDKKSANRKMNRIRDFQRAIGQREGDPIVPAELVGMTGWAILSLKDDPTYGEQNGIKRYVKQS